MTGFGRGEAGAGMVTVSVEARSVNHRHLDIALRLPRALAAHEMEARRLVQSRLERGRVDIVAQLGVAGERAQQVRIDTALARDYVARAREFGAAAGLGGDVTLGWVLERPGVIRTEEAEVAEDALWPLLADALGRALDELSARRGTEGEALATELHALHAELTTTVELIAARAPASAARREERLRERLRALLGAAPIDEARVVVEAAIWADKTDVTEELARLRAHLTQVALTLEKGGAVGRPLDFLIQELFREVNTIAAKADDLEISQSAIAAKGILEKMREQAQNLE